MIKVKGVIPIMLCKVSQTPIWIYAYYCPFEVFVVKAGRYWFCVICYKEGEGKNFRSGLALEAVVIF